MYDTYLISPVGSFRFPMAPKGFTVNGEKHFETVDIQDRGEIDYFTSAKKITQLEMEIMLPSNANTACLYEPIPDQTEALTLLKNMQEGGFPCRLIVSDFPYNAMVNFAQIELSETPEDLGDKMLVLHFREITGTGGYHGKRTIERKRKMTKLPTLRNNRAPLERPKKYYVKGKDQLWSLAKRYYGDGREYNRILAANNINDANELKSGRKLILP